MYDNLNHIQAVELEGPESKCTRITAIGLTLCQCNIKLLFCFYFIIDVRFIFVGLNVAKS